MPCSANLPTPNFLIMGAQKSGTTSLHHYLSSHEKIFMSNPVKEPGYFLGPEVAARFWARRGEPIASLDDLLQNRMLQGYAEQEWFGESSTYYTIGERARRFDIPQRIAGTTPNMRFIYVLREPVERIISHYHHMLNRPTPPESFQAFLDDHEGHAAFNTSMYHKQLSYYLEHFPRENFLLLRFEDLVRSPKMVTEQALMFLGLQPSEHLASATFETHNPSVRKSPPGEKNTLRQTIACDPRFAKLEQDRHLLSERFGVHWTPES